MPTGSRWLEPETIAAILAAIEGWGAEHAAAAVVDAEGMIASHGDIDLRLYWASTTKLVTTYAALVELERGVVALDDPVGPPGSTLRHLLAHASGLAMDGDQVLSAPVRTRIYSNTGFDLLADHLAGAAGVGVAALLERDVLAPLGMTSTRLEGPASHGLHGSLRDLARLGQELLAPTLVRAETLDMATTVAFPGLRGVLPGVGRYDPLDWGLGFELRDGKTSHWTGTRNSPRTFGHIGASGSLLWVDPDARLALACLSDRRLGPWALDAWPALSDAVLAAAR